MQRDTRDSLIDALRMYKLLVREKVILQRLRHPRVSSIISTCVTCDPRLRASELKTALLSLMRCHSYTDPYDSDIVYLVLRDGGNSKRNILYRSLISIL